MRLRYALALVGGLIGGNVGLLFGALPAGGLTFVVFDAWFSSAGIASEETLFVSFWGATILLTASVGAATGLLVDRLRRADEARRDDRHVWPDRAEVRDGDAAPALPR